MALWLEHVGLDNFFLRQFEERRICGEDIDYLDMKGIKATFNLEEGDMMIKKLFDKLK